ncbi:hypothetical protein ACFRMQ_27235 [Kitasatospora sp. NPDC056783]|uniref:hypothetical protein n=1 Tax=Kitasatospora sp. NPDC056783 TaxID=3345943 RepID=UPI0036A2EF0D
MNPHKDLVLKARVRLLMTDDWTLDGPDALWVYRTLFAVNPRVYAGKLVHTLLTQSRSPLVAGLPRARLALLEEAEAATAWMTDDPRPHQPGYVASVRHRAAELRRQLEGTGQ